MVPGTRYCFTQDACTNRIACAGHTKLNRSYRFTYVEIQSCFATGSSSRLPTENCIDSTLLTRLPRFDMRHTLTSVNMTLTLFDEIRIKSYEVIYLINERNNKPLLGHLIPDISIIYRMTGNVATFSILKIGNAALITSYLEKSICQQ